jgi:glutamine synthetase
VYAARDLPQVPTRMSEAIDSFAASALARRAFGDAVVDHYLHFARTERDAVAARVSDVERRRYFERI